MRPNPVDDLELARTILAPKELAVYELAHRGLSQRTIALALGISRSTVRDHLTNAARKITLARTEHAA